MSGAMKFAYSDPPYLGCGRYYVSHHPDALDWDDPETHRALFQRLADEYPDGWAVSCSTPSLRVLLPMTPEDTRIGAWVKPFAIFKPNVGVAYTWEPVLFRGGRKVTRQEPTRRDFIVAQDAPAVSENITLRKGLTGAKPPRFCDWVISILNAKPGDQFDDLFPGTGAFGKAWEAAVSEVRRQGGRTGGSGSRDAATPAALSDVDAFPSGFLCG